MSEATLKRKTAVKYRNMSVGNESKNNKGFSLNGTTRNQGYVGQDTLGRSLPKTIMKGNVVHGYGGCCDVFNTDTIVQSAVKCENDNTVVKKTVLSTKGMLAMKRMRYTDTEGNIAIQVVKPSSLLNNSNQLDYIVRKKKEAILNADSSGCQRIPFEPSSCCDIVANESLYNTDVDSSCPSCPAIVSNRKKYRMVKIKPIASTKEISIQQAGESYEKYLEKRTEGCVERNKLNISTNTNSINYFTNCG